MVVRSVLAALTATLLVAVFAMPTLPDPNFESAVARISARPFEKDSEKGVVVVTGSSSIRLWDNVATEFPHKQVVNTGFGGSTMRNLLRFHQELIVRYRPDQVVIHEGDNDLARGESSARVMQAAKKLSNRLRVTLPDTEVVFIAAKPSPARWRLHTAYEQFNGRLRKLAKTSDRIRFADVWPNMLHKGKPRTDIYRADGLHLNSTGYSIWASVLHAYLGDGRPTPGDQPFPNIRNESIRAQSKPHTQ